MDARVCLPCLLYEPDREANAFKNRRQVWAVPGVHVPHLDPVGGPGVVSRGRPAGLFQPLWGESDK